MTSRAAQDIRTRLWRWVARLLLDTAFRCELRAASQFNIDDWPVLRVTDAEHEVWNRRRMDPWS